MADHQPAGQPQQSRRRASALTGVLPTLLLLGGLIAAGAQVGAVRDALASSTSRAPASYLELAAAPAGGERLGTDCRAARSTVVFAVRNAGGEPATIPYTVKVRRLARDGVTPRGRAVSRSRGTISLAAGGTGGVETAQRAPLRGQWQIVVDLTGEDRTLVLRCGTSR